MEWKDLGRWLLILCLLLLFDLLFAGLGLREPKPSDYDRASIIAAFCVVLWAIRERDQTGTRP